MALRLVISAWLMLAWLMLMCVSAQAAVLDGRETDAHSADAHSDDCRTQAVAELTRNAQLGGAAEQFALAKSLLENACGPQDVADGLQWLRKSADAHHPMAAFRLAQLHLNGELVVQDMARALNYLRIAAQQDHIEAQHVLGLMILWHASSLDERHEGLYWLGAAAALGDNFSAVSLGMIHERGMHGVTADACLALDWYESAILMGYADPGGLYTKLKVKSEATCY